MTKKVLVYTTERCPWCQKAKDFLKEKNVSFEEVHVDKDRQRAEEMIEKSGQTGVPVIDIDGTIIIGFDRDSIVEALEE